MFRIDSRDTGFLPPAVYAPSKVGETYTLGEALVLSGGALTKCGATEKPQYIAEQAYVAPATDPRLLRVHKVHDFYIYETTMADNSGTVVVGDLVTLHTDAAQLTATKTGGVATIIAKESDLAGAKVLVRL